MAISTDPAYMYQDPTITTNSVIQGKDASEMDMNDFFNLLVAQLTNQDMMNPTNDTEFIAQMAQFSALQGVQTIQEYQLSSYAASYIGKFVTIANVTESGAMETIVGKVDSITYYDGKPKVVVNGKPYDLFTVMEINNEDGSGALAKAVKFMNHDVTVEVTDEEGNKSEVSGTVTGVGVSQGKPYVTVGGENYSVDLITLVDGVTPDEFLASLTADKTEEDGEDFVHPDQGKVSALISKSESVTAWFTDEDGKKVKLTGEVTSYGGMLKGEKAWIRLDHNGGSDEVYVEDIIEVDGVPAADFFAKNASAATTPAAQNMSTSGGNFDSSVNPITGQPNKTDEELHAEVNDMDISDGNNNGDRKNSAVDM